jgi:hypothetical protein
VLVRLRLELLFIKVLVWFATTSAPDSEVRPHVHLHLADLHFRLAAEYEARGDFNRARHHRRLANEHAAAGPPPPPRPAVAMAMPVPQPDVFTDARGFYLDDPDDVA